LQRREGEPDDAARRICARQPLHIDVLRRLLVEPDEIERGALPLCPALVVALEAEHGDSVRLVRRLGDRASISMMLYADVVEQVGHAARRTRPAEQIVAGNQSGAPVALDLRWPHQRLLRRLAHREVAIRADPAACRMIEALALPVARVATREMKRGLGGA